MRVAPARFVMLSAEIHFLPAVTISPHAACKRTTRGFDLTQGSLSRRRAVKRGKNMSRGPARHMEGARIFELNPDSRRFTRVATAKSPSTDQEAG